MLATRWVMRLYGTASITAKSSSAVPCLAAASEEIHALPYEPVRAIRFRSVRLSSHTQPVPTTQAPPPRTPPLLAVRSCVSLRHPRVMSQSLSALVRECCLSLVWRFRKPDHPCRELFRRWFTMRASAPKATSISCQYPSIAKFASQVAAHSCELRKRDARLIHSARAEGQHAKKPAAGRRPASIRPAPRRTCAPPRGAQLAEEADPLLLARFGRSCRLRRQLQHGGRLAFAQQR